MEPGKQWDPSQDATYYNGLNPTDQAYYLELLSKNLHSTEHAKLTADWLLRAENAAVGNALRLTYPKDDAVQKLLAGAKERASQPPVKLSRTLKNAAYLALPPSDRRQVLDELKLKLGGDKGDEYNRWLHRPDRSALLADYQQAHGSVDPPEDAQGPLQGLPQTGEALKKAKQPQGEVAKNIMSALEKVGEAPATRWLQKCDAAITTLLSNTPGASLAVTKALNAAMLNQVKKLFGDPNEFKATSPAEKVKILKRVRKYLGSEYRSAAKTFLENEDVQASWKQFHDGTLPELFGDPRMFGHTTAVEQAKILTSVQKHLNSDWRKAAHAFLDDPAVAESWQAFLDGTLLPLPYDGLYRELVPYLKKQPEGTKFAFWWKQGQVMLAWFNPNADNFAKRCATYVRAQEGGLFFHFIKKSSKKWKEEKTKKGISTKRHPKARDDFKKLFADVGATCAFVEK